MKVEVKPVWVVLTADNSAVCDLPKGTEVVVVRSHYNEQSPDKSGYSVALQLGSVPYCFVYDKDVEILSANKVQSSIDTVQVIST